MIRTAALAAVCLAAAIPAVHAEAPRPALKHSAVIAGDLVRIGDLVENAGIVADIPIFRAPGLGETGAVPAYRVVEAVRAHAIVGLDTRGIAEVSVTRPSRTVASREIQAEIARIIAGQHAVGPAADLLISLDSEVHTLNLEPAAAQSPRVLHLGYDTRSGRFDAMLAFGGMRPQRFTGTAAVTGAALTVTRAIARGEIIRNSDLTIDRRPKAELGRDVLVSLEGAIGRAARQPLRAGQVVRSLDVMKPELVQRDAAVTLFYQVPGITLTVRGKANEAGAEGDVISVTNLQSKRIVQGTVASNGTVIVTPAAPRIVANLDPAPALVK